EGVAGADVRRVIAAVPEPPSIPSIRGGVHWRRTSGRSASALCPHRDASPCGFRNRKERMGGLHLSESGCDLVWERCGLARRHVDMERQVLGSGRYPAFSGMKQLLEIVDPLGIVIDKLERDPHRVTGVEFTQVADVNLGGEDRLLTVGNVIRPDPDELVGLV